MESEDIKVEVPTEETPQGESTGGITAEVSETTETE